IREREFVSGARARGNRSLRLLLRHVLPNALTPIIVVATLELAFMIIYESALSFLGLGVQPPTPTWGWMLSDGRNCAAAAPDDRTRPPRASWCGLKCRRCFRW